MSYHDKKIYAHLCEHCHRYHDHDHHHYFFHFSGAILCFNAVNVCSWQIYNQIRWETRHDDETISVLASSLKKIVEKCLEQSGIVNIAPFSKTVMLFYCECLLKPSIKKLFICRKELCLLGLLRSC